MLKMMPAYLTEANIFSNHGDQTAAMYSKWDLTTLGLIEWSMIT